MLTTNTSDVPDVPLDCELPLGECEGVRVAKKIVLSLSIISTFAAILSVIILQKYKTFHQRIVFNILLASFLSSITYISGDGHAESAGTSNCIGQAFFVQFFDLTEFMWMCNLTVFLFLYTIFQRDTALREKIYTALGWGIPFILAFLPLTTMDYGPAAAPFCWVRNSGTGHVWRFVVYWVPVFGGLVVILLAFLFMIWRANQAMKQFTGANDPNMNRYRELLADYLKPLAGYAVAFVIVNLIQIAYRIHNAVHHTPVYGFMLFHTITLSSYGILLSTWFVITNGPNEFTLDKYKSGLLHHRRRLPGIRESSGIQEFPISAASTPPGTPQTQRAFPKGVAQREHDSGITV